MAVYRPASNGAAIRTVMIGGDVTAFRRAQRERENFVRRLQRRRRTPEQIQSDREYHRAYRVANRERIAARKGDWRVANRDKVNTYYRRYDELKPGRREYKAAKAREYRARDKAAAGGTA